MKSAKEFRRSVVSSYRRKRTREGRLLMLGRVLERVAQVADHPAKTVFGEFGEVRPSAETSRRLEFVGRGRRLISLLAEHAGRSPYRATQEVSPSQSRAKIADDESALAKPRPLWIVLEEYCDQLPMLERRMLEWRYGLFGQSRRSIGQIAHKVGASARTVQIRLRDIMLKAREVFSSYTQEEITGSVDCLG